MIKTAAQILQGRPRPVDLGSSRKGVGGRPPLHRECTLPECSKPHHGDGYCKGHWWANDKWGDPRHVYKRGRQGELCGCSRHSGVWKARSFL